jgi:FAD:protein FMN transferase
LDLYARRFSALGSRCEIQVVATSRAAARLALNAGEAEVARIEAKYSRYRQDSVLSEINRQAGHGPVEVDDETASLLDFGEACFVQSEGRFDLTSGVLRRAWTFRAGAVPPSGPVVADLLSRVGWQKVEWRKPLLRLPVIGMELDFGGIGKEYAADRVAARCLELGARGGIVNLGGDLRVLGPQPNGAPWRLGVEHPRIPGKVLAGIVLSEGAIATSGDSERYFDYQGTRYCHILDARTGWSVVAPPQSVTVVAPLCTVAGGLTTLAMLSAGQAADFLGQQSVPYLLVDASGTVSGSLASRDSGQRPPPAPTPIELD